MVIAEDEHGTGLVVFGLPGQGDVLGYPANLVAKRWERREANLIGLLFHEIANQVPRISSERSQPKPCWKLW